MEFKAEVQYFVDRSIRRGMVTWYEIGQLDEEHGTSTANAVAERLHSAGVPVVDDRSVGITPRTNVLMNDLTLVELVSLCLQLPVMPQTRRRLYRPVLKRRSYELDLTRLEYLDSDYEWYYLSPAFNSLQRSIRSLFNSDEIPFARLWQVGGRKTERKYIQALTTHPAFAAHVLPKLRKHYLSLKPVTMLVSWIRATEEQKPSIDSVIRVAINQDGVEAVRSLLLSNQASTALSVLDSGRDICFSCAPEQRCLPLREVDNTYTLLTTYRTTTLETLLATRYSGWSLENCVTLDGLLAKFYLPYSVVVSTKRWMLATGVLSEDSNVLDKSHGKYCPKNDIWVLMHEKNERK